MDSTPSFSLLLAFNIAITVAGALFGWLFRTLFARIDKTDQMVEKLFESLNELRVVLPTHYVSKSDFREMGDNIFQALRRIEDRVHKIQENHRGSDMA